MPGRRVHSDDAIANYVRKNTITTYHFAGSCSMGTADGDPVDTQLRLRGVTGLRIADASVIPWTPVSALNAPSMLIGYRAARLLRNEAL
jgi:choline dehydrogenase